MKLHTLSLSVFCVIVVTLGQCVYASQELGTVNNDALIEILYHEPLPNIHIESEPGNTSKMRCSLTGFGWEFDLVLESNNRIVSALPHRKKMDLLRTCKLYRGHIDGVDGSWVRLAKTTTKCSGMIWDGTELYVIDPREAVQSIVADRSRNLTADNVIYKLSDVVGPEKQTCANDPLLEKSQPIFDYAHLVDELRGQVPLDASGANLNLDMSVVTDIQFSQIQEDMFGTTTPAAVVARINVVDGIFSEQLGVQINLIDIIELDDNGSLTSTNPNTLLTQFSEFSGSPGFVNPGAAHLFTGRDLDGTTVGIAFIGSLCNTEFGVAVDEIRGGGTSGALLVAHEMGHIFGAPHDNQSGSPCASTPGTFLMNFFLNGSDQFSQCSIDQMLPVIDTVSCLTTIDINLPPSVTITSPQDGETLLAGTDIEFIGDASDPEDGDLGKEIVWTSNQDGNLGTGRRIVVALSEGSHNITASVLDRGGLDANDIITITVEPDTNLPPSVTITSPQDGETLLAGTDIEFIGDASDPEDGDLGKEIVWTSDQDGNLGIGSRIVVGLSKGPHTIAATVADSKGLEASDSITITVLSSDNEVVIFQSGFNTNNGGFVYADDAFGTDEPDYADGTRLGAGGINGGVLRVLVGGVDDERVFGMSGGWSRSFTLDTPHTVKLSFYYNLTLASNYEPNEFSEVLVGLDDDVIGPSLLSALTRLTGDGTGGPDQSTGWVLVNMNLGNLAAGPHTLTIGAFNNKKTSVIESTELLIDDVIVTGESLEPVPPGPQPDPEIIFENHFATSKEQFFYTDDTFRNSNAPAYESGRFASNIGFSSGGIRVLLGGRDESELRGISAGWTRMFSVGTTGRVSLSFRYNLTLSGRYESDEFSEVLVAIDDNLISHNGNEAIATINGDGNGGSKQTTGWVLVALDIGELDAGEHTVTLGGYNNKKDAPSEWTTIAFDDVIMTKQ